LETPSQYGPVNRLNTPWVSLVVGFGLLFFCMLVGSNVAAMLTNVFYGSSAGLLDLARDPEGHIVFRMVQIVSALLVWGLAATMWSMFAGGFKKRLGFQYRTWSGFFLLAAGATVIALPLVEWMLFNEETFKLPASLLEFETWVHTSEASSQEIMLLVLGDLSPMAVLGNILTIAIVPAVVEEMFFRGFLLGTLRRMVNPHVAVWLGALIFSFIHFQFYGILSRMVLGAMLGYFYLWSGSLWTSILAHFTHNFISLLIALLAIRGNLPEEIIAGDSLFGPLTFLCSLCLSLPLLYVFYRNSRKRNTLLSYEK